MAGGIHPAIDWNWVLLTFCLDWPWTAILPVSASWVARITVLSHCAQPNPHLYFIFGNTGVWTQGLLDRYPTTWATLPASSLHFLTVNYIHPPYCGTWIFTRQRSLQSTPLAPFSL
jgi:hypothetical protein